MPCLIGVQFPFDAAKCLGGAEPCGFIKDKPAVYLVAWFFGIQFVIQGV
jgi:hypothetical protein